MNSSYLFLIVIASLLCCLNCSSSQTTTRVFDEKKFLGNLHAPERIDHYAQLVRKYDSQHDYSFVTDQPAIYRDQLSTSNHHEQRNSFPYRKTSSSSWFQQHPVASPIRSPSHEQFADPINGDSVTIEPLSNNNQSTNREELRQSNWPNRSNSSSDSQQDNADSLDNDKTRTTHRPPSEARFATTTATTKIIYNSDLSAANNNNSTQEASLNGNLIIDRSRDLQNHITYQQAQHSYNGTTRVSGHIPTKSQYANYTNNNKDEIDRGPFYASKYSTKLNESNSNNTYNNQQNSYQQSTIKLTSIKTFEGSTDLTPAIIGTSNDNLESNSISGQSTNWWYVYNHDFDNKR